MWHFRNAEDKTLPSSPPHPARHTPLPWSYSADPSSAVAVVVVTLLLLATLITKLATQILSKHVTWTSSPGQIVCAQQTQTQTLTRTHIDTHTHTEDKNVNFVKLFSCHKKLRLRLIEDMCWCVSLGWTQSRWATLEDKDVPSGTSSHTHGQVSS